MVGRLGHTRVLVLVKMRVVVEGSFRVLRLQTMGVVPRGTSGLLGLSFRLDLGRFGHEEGSLLEVGGLSISEAALAQLLGSHGGACDAL